MKKFWKYFTLTILLLLGLCCIGILYLFFIPNSSLFNVKYISLKDYTNSKKYDIKDVNKIILNSRAYDVNILSSENDEISVTVHSKSFGFVLIKNSTTSISSKLQNSTLTYEISEPYGAAFTNSSYINLYIPKTKAIDLSLTNKKAETTIDGKDVQINKFNYTTEKGDISLVSGSINDTMNLNLYKADCVIESNFQTNSNNINLKISTGKFDATSATLADVNILGNSRGVIQLNKCSQLTQTNNSAGGRIEVLEVNYVNVTSGDTNIYANSIKLGAIINLKNSGSVEIQNLAGDSSIIETNFGSIMINKLNSTATLNSTSGDITVKNATYQILTTSNSGNININFAKTAPKNSEESFARDIVAKNNNGNIRITNAEHVSINTVGKGEIFVQLTDIHLNNYIAGNNGSVKVVIDKFAVYKLTTNKDKPTTGNVKVNLSQISEYGGYTDKSEKSTFINCSKNNNGGNFLEVSTTSGNLTILDTNLI